MRYSKRRRLASYPSCRKSANAVFVGIGFDKSTPSSPQTSRNRTASVCRVVGRLLACDAMQTSLQRSTWFFRGRFGGGEFCRRQVRLNQLRDSQASAIAQAGID